VTRLSYRFIRADNVGVGHDERKVTRERHARIRGYDRDLWRRRTSIISNIPARQPSFFFFLAEEKRRLTLR
jgi:hypothetical protein